MTAFARFLVPVALVAGGIALGVYVQHRWPVGRWRDDLQSRPTVASRSVADIARIPADRRLVLLCVGQSNAANYGPSRRSAGPGVYAFVNGKLFEASDPLPGGDGYGGSIWTRLGARLAATGRYDAVVFALAARGSSKAGDWAAHGSLHPQLQTQLSALAALKFDLDAVLWVQGEQEARDPSADGREYIAAVQDVARTCRTAFPHAAFFVANATRGSSINEQIRQAQVTLGTSPGFSRGPDLDQLGDDFRRDGIHFNDAGLERAAELWFDRLASLPANHGAQ